MVFWGVFTSHVSLENVFFCPEAFKNKKQVSQIRIIKSMTVIKFTEHRSNANYQALYPVK